MKKKLGNIKNKAMSKFITLDLLDADADAKVKDIKKSHTKTIERNRSLINEIYLSVLYFKQKFTVRRERLRVNLETFVSNEYVTPSYSWLDDYDEIMNETRGNNK